MDDDSRNENETNLWISVREAAQQLGISERAVQIQAQRGRITSKREGKQWLVCLEPTENFSETRNETQAKRNETKRRNDSPLVAQQQAEIDFLRTQLLQAQEDRRRTEELHATETAELRRLLMINEQQLLGMQEQVQRLLPPAPAESAPMSPDDTETTQMSELVPSEQEPAGGLTQGEADHALGNRKRHWWQVWRR